ncbi:hypothetical protein KZ469_02175 [Glaesserella parasuis]|nr:hypothetical protein [Glaesserella parasuis]MCT8781142.1 hypothetical protein [Glaesserella parasuis]MCT8821530.1 hypothetical protein [Glaesserella parasuis]MDE3931079.1 hypothetical protein [Glaesserella parasuis]MDE3934935.1 hypothetical protein [Glaesserella parasuis]
MERKATQFLKVLRRLIFSSISGLDGYVMNMTSARNYVSRLERKHLTGKVKRTREKTVDGTGGYYRYELANREQLKQTIAIYKAKGGELTQAEEQQAYERFK